MTPNQSSRLPNVLSHWYAFIDGVQFSSEEFYRSIESELAERKLPRAKFTRTEFHEGSVLSDKRVYLRLARERFAFDICAAPFGRGYFFSLRFVEKPRGTWVQLLVWIFGIVAALAFLSSVSSVSLSSLLLALAALVAIGSIAAVARAKSGMESPSPAPVSGGNASELPDFDAFLLNLPGIGEWYERIRSDTYYRHDTRLLFHSIVSEVVKKKVDEVTAAKGIKYEAKSFNPIFGELYPAERKSEPQPVQSA